MKNAAAAYAVGQVAVTDDFEPDIVDRTQVGEFRQLEPGADTEGLRLDASVWRADPASVPAEFSRRDYGPRASSGSLRSHTRDCARTGQLLGNTPPTTSHKRIIPPDR